MAENVSKFKQFDLVETRGSSTDISVVLLGPFEIPCYEDGVGSFYSKKPLEPSNPDEWGRTFPGYIVYNLIEDRYDIFAEHNMVKFEKLDEIGHPVTYRPFDQGTGRLRNILGLIKLSYTLSNDEEGFEKHFGFKDNK
jgi:hypothetical protein